MEVILSDTILQPQRTIASVDVRAINSYSAQNRHTCVRKQKSQSTARMIDACKQCIMRSADLQNRVDQSMLRRDASVHVEKKREELR